MRGRSPASSASWCARAGSTSTVSGATRKRAASSRRIGRRTVAARSRQLPTGSAKITSGARRANESAARSRSDRRQQKQPPATSRTGTCATRASAVSTSPLPWSFVTMPTRRPASVSRRAASIARVVLPAPRRPPMITSVGWSVAVIPSSSDDQPIVSAQHHGRTQGNAPGRALTRDVVRNGGAILFHAAGQPLTPARSASCTAACHEGARA